MDRNIDYLIAKVLDGTASTGEIEELARWMQEAENEVYFQRLKKAWHAVNGLTANPEREEEELQRFIAYIRSRANRRLTPRRWLKYTAIVVLSLAGGTALYLSREAPRPPEEPIEIATVTPPGSSKATLLLHDRTSIELSDDRGVIVQQDSILPHKGGKGVSVLPALDVQENEERWHRLITPRGGEYQLTLSDGTCIYLNSETTVEFPAGFRADRREVKLTGEAYFEVAAESDRPFTVVTGKSRVRVYGTSFNINAYAHAGTRVALLSGAISIQGIDSDREYLLRPSQLAEFDAQGHFTGIRKVDAHAHAAWKEGFFVFENENIETILTILSRWYNVEVFYIDESIKEYHFTGSVERYEKIETILTAISKMIRVKFSIHDKTVTMYR
ncbi:MAG: FecR family protein [Odoribacteraceae bacterium]|jgi:ferric-dicitrate binding protein FerR (iron transport regulator)|nr:FecR family protein [Odoribacteraceae bacterium]